MTPQAKIKARLLELAGPEEVGIRIQNRKGAYYAVLEGGFGPTRQLILKLFPGAYMTSGGGGSVPYRIWPESAVEEVLQEMEVDPAWLAWNAGTVGSLARGIRDASDFTRLPVLADALEEAGCTNTALLNHCRDSESHERSCWVVDLLLGKSK